MFIQNFIKSVCNQTYLLYIYADKSLKADLHIGRSGRAVKANITRACAVRIIA